MKLFSCIAVALLASLSAFAAEEEKVKPRVELEVLASEYNLRAGDKLQNFGWRFLGATDKYCVYRSGVNKHLINADRFEKERCPDVLVAVKKKKAN